VRQRRISEEHSERNRVAVVVVDCADVSAGLVALLGGETSTLSRNCIGGTEVAVCDGRTQLDIAVEVATNARRT